jgi:hypothetical protein
MLRHVLIFFVSAAPLGAWAAHPLVSDDTGTQGDRRLALELNAQAGRDRTAETLDEAAAAAAILSVGVGDAVDLVLGLPTAWTRTRAGGEILARGAGVTDATLELKWRFLELGGFSLALKPGVSLPTGDPLLGLGSGDVGYGASLIATQALGPVAVHLNAAWSHDDHAAIADRASHRHDAWRGSVAATARVAAGVQVVANVAVESPAARGATPWPAYALAGAICSVGPGVDLDAGVRFGLDAAAPDVAFLAGATWRL